MRYEKEKIRRRENGADGRQSDRQRDKSATIARKKARARKGK